ncbi:MAG TPA: class I SAM-dependent methyltransferase [Rhodocyclaceae bacterium]|nr:class I SAM-dependent methyltransferase [Rhodocyclaceae bacterium]
MTARSAGLSRENGLSTWLASPQGRYILNWEQVHFDLAVADIFGYIAVQIGFPDFDFLRANRIPSRFRADVSGAVDVRLELGQLPFASASVDLVVLPHALEFAEDPHQVLREVERVLIPEGRVVVSGFNPFSLWGLYRNYRRVPSEFPWSGHYLSVRRLSDWLRLLGFEIEAGQFGCYAAPVRSEIALRRNRLLESSGARWWPFAGATYVLQAVKRMRGLRLIPHGRRDRRVRATRLAPAVERRDDQPESVIRHHGPGHEQENTT